MFRQDFTCPALLDVTTEAFSRTGLSPFVVLLSRKLPLTLPQLDGLLPFRSSLLRESRLISFPPVT